MPAKESVAMEEHFAEVTDPRRREGTYPLINSLVIAVCAVICGADDFVAIAEFGRAKKKFLWKFLDLSAGIPSHDRFNAIFRALKPAEFEKALLSWITALHEVTDGRTDRLSPSMARHSVAVTIRLAASRRSIWSVLGQRPTTSPWAKSSSLKRATRSPRSQSCWKCLKSWAQW